MLLSNISSWSLACNLIFIMEINDKHTELSIFHFFPIKGLFVGLRKYWHVLAFYE